MGMLGDVRAAQMSVVEVDNSHFSLIGAGVRVHTTALPNQLAAAQPGTYLVGHYGAKAMGTEVIRPQTMQVLPTKYVAAFIPRDGVLPAMAYQELSGRFAADGVLDSCAGILAWLRVACTACGGGGELAAEPAVLQAFPLLLLPATLSDYVAAKVYADLPSRQQRGVRAPTGDLDQVVTAVQQLAANVVEVGGHGSREPKGVM